MKWSVTTLALIALAVGCTPRPAEDGRAPPLPPLTAQPPEVPANPQQPPMSVRVTGTEGAYTGFDLVVRDKSLATLSLCSNDAILAGKLAIVSDNGNRSFRLEELRAAEATGLNLGDRDYVLLRLRDGECPELEFRVSVEEFDKEKWEGFFGGRCPFHFLALSLDDAEILHHRGWLVATPKLDPYTLQVGRQGIVASKWSRDWTWSVPFGACPIPVAALWTPSTGCYVGMDFTEARLYDHTEKYIASPYCWQQGRSRSFVALSVPFGNRYKGLRLPLGGEVAASHCRIVYYTDLPSHDDPNRRYHRKLWTLYRDRLPGAPIQNDLWFLPGYARAARFPGAGQIGLTYTVPKKDRWESHFFEEGTIIPTGGPGYMIDLYVKRGRTDMLDRVKKELEYVLGKLKWFDVNGQKCAYWEKPLEGTPRPRFAGDVTSKRNIHGWQIADVMLAIYQHEKDPEYLEIVEGVLKWTKYNVCTRNDISDVPEAMFTIGWGATRLCLRYYYMFRDDPVRAQRARECLDLANALTYRYLTMFFPDTAEDDNITGVYLIEPNSGQPWTGAPCANECCSIPDEVLRTYVATGDPILLAYLRGMIERWSLLYQDEDADDCRTYDAPFAECFGLFDECNIGGRNKRSTYGGMMSSFRYIQPIGDALVRVVCGEKGAVAFCKKGMHTDVAGYRAGPNPDGAISFRVVSSLPGEFDLIVTTPNRDITSVPVLRRRSGKTARLSAGVDYVVPDQSIWDVVVKSVRADDVIALGRLDESLPTIDIRPVKGWSAKPADFSAEGFRMLDLSPHCNWRPKLDWDDNNSFAPYFPGEHYAFGVPYFLIPAALSSRGTAVRDADLRVSVKAEALALFVSHFSERTKLTVTTASGTRLAVPVSDRLVAWQAWPKWFTQRIEMLMLDCPGEEVTSIDVRHACLWAVTAADRKGTLRIAAVREGLRRQEELALAEARRREEWKRGLKAGHSLCFEVDCPQASSYCFAYVYVNKGAFEIPKRAYLEYDCLCPWDSVRTSGAVDLTGGSVGNIRDRVGSHPSNRIEPRGEWIHRKYDLSSLAGEKFEYVVVATDGRCPAGSYRTYYRSIHLTDGNGKVLLKLYDNGSKVPSGEIGISPNGGIKEMENPRVSAVPAGQVRTGTPVRLMIADENGLAKDDFSAYPGGDGSPTWKIGGGVWSVSSGVYVGANCSCRGWHAEGAQAGDPSWRDYRLSLRFRIMERGSDWRDGAWIGFRTKRSGRSGYSLNMHDRLIALHKAFGGRETGDANPLASVPWQPDDKWHSVEITARGAHITVKLDGKIIIDVEDTNALDMPPVRSGNVVLCARRYEGSEGDTRVAFDDVEVQLLK